MAFLKTEEPLKFYDVTESTVDEFGDQVAAGGRWRDVLVASWWIDRVDEKRGDSILRTIETLKVHCLPEDAPGPSGRIRTPDGDEWEVKGPPDDYNHGFHQWVPGLVQVNAERVKG